MFETALLTKIGKKNRISHQSVNDAYQLPLFNRGGCKHRDGSTGADHMRLGLKSLSTFFGTQGSIETRLWSQKRTYLVPNLIQGRRWSPLPDFRKQTDGTKWLKLTGQDMSKAHERLYPHLKHISSGIRSSVAHGARAMKKQGEDRSQLPDVRKLKYLRCLIDLRTGSAALQILDVGASTQTHVLESVATWWYGILYGSRRDSSQADLNVCRHHDDAFALR
jgi:hypothetical protein